MAFDRFMIAPIKTGLKDDEKPWLIPDDAFERLENAYVYEGRVRKRFGSRYANSGTSALNEQLGSRCKIELGITDINGDFSGTAPGFPFTAVGQAFSIGDEIFTVNALGTPGTLLTTGTATVHTFNTTSGALVITGSGSLTDVYFYPSLPIMGITNFEVDGLNFEPTIVFDTKFAYRGAGGRFERIGTAAWTGTNADFFWAHTTRGVTAAANILFVTNFVVADQIKYWDGVTWTTVNPIYNSVTNKTIETARIIVAFHERLLFFNTVEVIGITNTKFVNRCRFSQFNVPLVFDEIVPGKGGFIDATTKQEIVSAAFLKDRLIVFFERSTWEIVYTQNEVAPFRWQQINSELGVESTFSVVPFDKAVLGIGNVGIHSCNGVNVQRIDKNIHHLVFGIHNDNGGIYRVHGVRDYFTQMVYWTYPDSMNDPMYPTHVLTFNYETGSWGVNDDTITAFGYYQLDSDLLWEDLFIEWKDEERTWADGAGSQGFRDLLAGNQQGYVFTIDADSSTNASVLQVTDITIALPVVTIASIDHNVPEGSYIRISNAQGVTGINDINFAVDTVTANAFTIKSAIAAGTYTGGATIERVSRIDILTKEYNFYAKDGRNMFISKVDFLVDKTTSGEITVDAFPSFSDVSILEDGAATGAALGTGILETSPYTTVPLESHQIQFWHSVYLQAEGEVVQLHIYHTDAQMLDHDISSANFEIDAMTFYVTPTSDRLQ